MRGRGPVRSEQSVRGVPPKDKKCGSLAAIYATLGCSAASCLEFLRRNKTHPQQHRCQRPPTSVATFCEHLCQQNAARQFNRSEVSFNSRRRVAESKLGKQVRRIHSDQRLRPLRLRQSYNRKSDLCQSLRLLIPCIICRIASSPKCHSLQ